MRTVVRQSKRAWGTCGKPCVPADPLVGLYPRHQRLIKLESRRQGGRRVNDSHAGEQYLPHSDEIVVERVPARSATLETAAVPRVRVRDVCICLPLCRTISCRKAAWQHVLPGSCCISIRDACLRKRPSRNGQRHDLSAHGDACSLAAVNATSLSSLTRNWSTESSIYRFSPEHPCGEAAAPAATEDRPHRSHRRQAACTDIRVSVYSSWIAAHDHRLRRTGLYIWARAMWHITRTAGLIVSCQKQRCWVRGALAAMYQFNRVQS